MNLNKLVRKTYSQVVTVQEFTGYVDSEKQYGPQKTIDCRIKSSTWQENKFYSKETMDYSVISCQTRIGQGALVWKPGTDTTNREDAIEVSRVDEVYDLAGNFIHFLVHL